MNPENIEKQIRYQIKQLSTFTESSYESDDCLKYLSYIDKAYTDRNTRNKVADILGEANYPAICINLLRYYDEKHVFESDRIWFCTYYLLHSIWNFSDLSRKICLQTCESGYVPILLAYIANQEIIDHFDENEEQLLKISINILHNIAQQSETKVTFRDHCGTEIIKLFSKINHDQMKVLAYLCLAHIVNEDEIRELNDASGGVIKFIINNLREAYKQDNHKHKGMSAREYLAGLSKLAVNRDNKFKMIECGILGIFKEILKYENPIDEQKYTLTCVWNLCFEDKIREAIKKDKEFLLALNKICENTPSDELRKSCAGIFYTINELPKKNETKPTRSSHRNHIMISYNSGSRDMCVKLKDKLKSDGFKVWIDVEQIQGSALQSMAEAVENSAVILVCITERYYQSPNCRLEAEYAIRLNKPIIPLLMQHKYSPQGWLGISIGSKIYYNLASYSIEEKYPLLIKEVKSYYSVGDDQEKSRESPSPRKQTPPPQPKPNLSLINKPVQHELVPININHTSIPIHDFNKQQTKTKQITSWTQRDVKDWLTKLNITTLENGSFDDVDGKCLYELYEMKTKAPEFFYNLLKEKLTTWKKLVTGEWDKYFKLSDLLRLSNEISALFKPEDN